jgi:hypothetical protein
MIDAYLTNQVNTDDRAIHLLFAANRWEKEYVACVYVCMCVCVCALSMISSAHNDVYVCRMQPKNP